jgi:hypothetical protein
MIRVQFIDNDLRDAVPAHAGMSADVTLDTGQRSTLFS